MVSNQALVQETNRKLSWLSYGGNLVGALTTFLYLSIIDPAPVEQSTVRTLELDDLAVFAIATVVIFTGALALGNRLYRPIQHWLELIETGRSASELPLDLARRVLNWPLMASAIVAAAWLLVAIIVSLFYDNPNNFVGIAMGGVVTTTIIFSGTDLLWRRFIPLYFPQGSVSTVPAFRLWVHRRLLLAFFFIGAITPILLVLLTLERTRALPQAGNPNTILNNLILAQLYVLIVGLAAGVIVAILTARAIVSPLHALQRAMGRVKDNDYEARAAVTSNDELGFLTERFNQMTGGLRQGELLRRLFGLYVSPEVARAAVETGAGLGGELVNCTVMFSDIRGFTSLTEQLPPEELVDLINHYMTAMVSVIVKHGGVVTRFGGDSILAVFGTSLNPMPDHAERAVAAGVEMRQALAAFNQESTNPGRTALDNGIGIASGQVIAGNVGGKERIEYTVMGDAANLAARLEDMTRDVGFPILMSSETFQALDEAKEPAARELGNLRVKGKQEKVTAYGLSV